MPVALPPANAPPVLPLDYELPGGMIARERALWLVEVRPARRPAEPCPEATAGEIVVCAAREDDPARDRLGPPLPDAPTAMEVLSRAMDVKIGPAEIHPTTSKGVEGEAVAGVSVRIKF